MTTASKIRKCAALLAFALIACTAGVRPAAEPAPAARESIGKPAANLLIPARTKLIIGYSRIALA